MFQGNLIFSGGLNTRKMRFCYRRCESEDGLICDILGFFGIGMKGVCVAIVVPSYTRTLGGPTALTPGGTLSQTRGISFRDAHPSLP